MNCPKCGARIGVYRRNLTVSTGDVSGISCYVCGFWRNEEIPPVIVERTDAVAVAAHGHHLRKSLLQAAV